MKKNLKVEQVNTNLNFFKTFLTSLVLILVFSILEKDSLIKIIDGKGSYTIIE